MLIGDNLKGMNGERMIKISNVWKKYETVTALKNVSLEFKRGRMYSIMGPSGSGKTTLLNMIATLSQPTDGEIVINGEKINEMSNDNAADLRNNHIGFVFQAFNLFPRLTAEMNVAVPMFVQKDLTLKQIKSRSITLLTELGLGDRVTHFPGNLSAGEKQRVALARAMANNPDIILADEPTGNLDAENEKYVLSKLRKLSDEGKTIIVVSHNPVIKEYAHENITMSFGEVVSVE